MTTTTHATVKTPAHTPLPWEVESDGDIVSIYGTARNGDDWTICDMGLPVDLAGMNTDNLSQRILDEREANAAFIVRACNSHYLLTEALRDAREQILSFANARGSECEWSDEELVEYIDAALSQAGGASE